MGRTGGHHRGDLAAAYGEVLWPPSNAIAQDPHPRRHARGPYNRVLETARFRDIICEIQGTTGTPLEQFVACLSDWAPNAAPATDRSQRA
jgi:hypothetical protein